MRAGVQAAIEREMRRQRMPEATDARAVCSLSDEETRLVVLGARLGDLSAAILEWDTVAVRDALTGLSAYCALWLELLPEEAEDE